MFTACLLVLLFCVTATLVHDADAEPARRRNKCLPEDIKRSFVAPTKDGFDVQLPVLNVDRRCRGKAEYIIRWTPQGENTIEHRIEWYEQYFSATGLKPWTKVNIKIHMEYKRNPQEDKEDYIDEHTPVVEKDITTLKGVPSPPRNFREDEIGEEHIRLAWDPPEAPNGPIDGYAYTVCGGDTHCDIGMDTTCKLEADTSDSSTQDLLRPRPLRYYRVALRAFNQDGDRRSDRLYSDSVMICVRFPPKPVKPLENVKVKCANGPNRIIVSWDFPKEFEVSEIYIVEMVGRKDGRSSVEVTKMANKTSDCDATTCTVTVQDLKAGYEYSVSVRPYIHHIGPFGEGYAVKTCSVSPSAPPPASKEPIKLENSALKTTEAEFAFWKDMYNDRNGEITHYDVLVAEDKEIAKCSQPTEWKDAHSKSPVPCYYATPEAWTPFTNGASEVKGMRCTSNATYAKCVVGSDMECGEGRCNGPLKEEVNYGVRIRAYTEGGSTDSLPVYIEARKATGKKSGGKRINIDVSAVVITGIILPLAFAKVLSGDQ